MSNSLRLCSSPACQAKRRQFACVKYGSALDWQLLRRDGKMRNCNREDKEQ
jgi:hypothetical protein